MRSGKTIDISKSSLVSLKAELSRKQEEVRLVKGVESYIKLPPKPKEALKVNPGVEERNKQDEELLPEEIDLLKKSREVLEVKAKLYDVLHKGSLVPEDGQDRYLVDFKHKDAPSVSRLETSQTTTSEKEESQSDDDISGLDDSEWVEYTDCLGRTRTCHRSDLAEMKLKDREMGKELHQHKDGAQVVADEMEQRPDLLLSDMEREAMRKKWEQQEEELLNKKDIHYEDILFDEARAHGVGYFRFSRDEAVRRKEQETLRKVREETEARQREAGLLRARREGQRQARLIAARQRQRARLGLPPLSEQEILGEIVPKEEVPEEEPIGPLAPAEKLEAALTKAAHVRPWDVGKGQDPQPVLSQEEWNERQRSERRAEFAPSYEEDRPLWKRRKPGPARDMSPLSLEREIEARLGHIRDQILGDKLTKE